MADKINGIFIRMPATGPAVVSLVCEDENGKPYTNHLSTAAPEAAGKIVELATQLIAEVPTIKKAHADAKVRAVAEMMELQRQKTLEKLAEK